MVQRLGPVPDGSALGSLTAYTSTVKDGPVFVHRVGQTHTWDSLFLSDGGCDTQVPQLDGRAEYEKQILPKRDPNQPTF